MLERLFGRNDDNEEDQTGQGPDGTQPPGEGALPGQAGQPGQPAGPMDGDGTPENDGPDVGELDVRLGELEEDVDSLESSLRAVQSSQDEFADTIEEMNDRVRQLVGVYDRLNAADNPFVDDAATHAGGANTAGGASAAGEPGAAGSGGAATPAENDRNGDEGSVVSFDDLEGETRQEDDTDPSDEDGDSSRAGGDGETSAVDGDDETGAVDAGGETGEGHEDPSSDGGQLPEDVSNGTASNGDGTHAPPSEPESDTAAVADARPVLESVPDSYAGEVLVMEWLSVLMEGSGPADALRAVGHYEDAGWISREVRDHLVDVIGGPTLDVHVDPTQSRESTAEEHAVSYRYLSVLAHLDGI